MNREIDARCHKEQAADDALAVVMTDERSSSVEVCFAELVEAIGKNKIAVSYRKDNEVTVETIDIPGERVMKGLIKELSTYKYLGKENIMTFGIKCCYIFINEIDGITITVYLYPMKHI